MMNQIILVGRVYSIDKDKKIITLSVNASTKNDDGIYPTYYVDITTSENIFEKSANYISLNDVVGVKGHIERENIKENYKIIADRLTFLSSKNASQED